MITENPCRTIAANNARQIGEYPAKGFVVRVVGAVAVGALEVEAADVGAPVATVTGVVGVLGVVGGVALGYDVIGRIKTRSWAGLTYNVGSLAGSAAVGGMSVSETLWKRKP